MMIDPELLGGCPARKLAYGTSGFRENADLMSPVVNRVGYVTVLRCLQNEMLLGRPLACGIMITASHNPVQDNGVKIVDWNGAMLPVEWEEFCTEVVNAAGDASSIVQKIFPQKVLDFSKCTIIIGVDTRPSSPSLRQILLHILNALSVNVIDMGQVTTPQLHYAVFIYNSAYNRADNDLKSSVNYLDLYNENFSTFFNKFNSELNSICLKKCIVDSANGIGGPRLEDFSKRLSDLEIITRSSGEGILNFKCGADYVKSNHLAPYELESDVCYCSFDGDADRIVFYTQSSKDANKFVLLDGDRIASLLVVALHKLLSATGLENSNITVVQTAYANGASTLYLENNLNAKVVFASTGVKHLHRAAEQADIGVYFEANGHGTVLYSKQFRDKVSSLDASKKECRLLKLFVSLTNSVIGDAITDMLLVIASLNYLEWTMQDWVCMYTELPAKMTKVKVKDRYLITVTNADREIVQPEGMQKALNEFISTVNGSGRSRCFIRPSGTEDVVRVYAEGAADEDVDKLIAGAEKIISSFL